MGTYKKYTAVWTVPSPGNLDGYKEIRAEVEASSRGHALSKLLCNTRYQMDLLLAFGREIENGTFSHHFLLWPPWEGDKERI